MTKNTKLILLGTGITIAAGTLAYIVCKATSTRKSQQKQNDNLAKTELTEEKELVAEQE